MFYLLKILFSFYIFQKGKTPATIMSGGHPNPATPIGGGHSNKFFLSKKKKKKEKEKEKIVFF
jgi:hypothetical protein